MQISFFENLLPIFSDFFLVIITFSVVIFLFGRKVTNQLSIRKILTTKALRLFYSRYSIAQAWDHFQKPFFHSEGGRNTHFLDFFTKEVFQKEFFEYSHFLILGPSGSGKTVALIRLFAQWKYALREEALHIRFISLSGPNIYKNIKTIPKKSETILLIDNLDSKINQSNYREAMDELLDATQEFARVVVACQSGFFPSYMEGTSGDEVVRFTGETNFQIFRRIELIPWNQQRSIRYTASKIGLLNLRKRHRAKKWISSNPALFERPGNLTWIREALLSTEVPKYPYQLTQTVIHGLIGKVKPEAGTKENVFAFLVELALNIKKQNQSEWLMDATPIKELAQKYQVEPAHFNYQLLEMSKEGFARIISPEFLSYFLAWKGFHSGWEMHKTSWKAFPEIRKYFLQMCWEAFISLPEVKENGVCYLEHSNEKRSCLEVAFPQITHISRIYIPKSVNDWRFLKGLKRLKAIYFQSIDASELTIELLKELPHQNVIIHLKGKALKVNTQFNALISEESLLTKPVLHYLDLIAPGQTLKINQSYIDHQPKFHRIFPEELNALFETDILTLDGQDYNPHLQTYLNESKTYQDYLPQPELGLFDRIVRHLQPDQSYNIVLSNRHAPTLLMDQLKQIIKELYELYGEDDHNLALFNDDDQIQIEEGYWFGRTWAWKVSDAYLHPMQIYMPEAGCIRLEIYGISGNFVDSPSDKKLSTNTSS